MLLAELGFWDWLKIVFKPEKRDEEAESNLNVLNWKLHKLVLLSEKLDVLGKGAPRKGVFLLDNKFLQQGFIIKDLIDIISLQNENYQKRKKQEKLVKGIGRFCVRGTMNQKISTCS